MDDVTYVKKLAEKMGVQPYNIFHDGNIVPDWTFLIKYPNLLYRTPVQVINTLNTLQELIPITFNYDRVGTFLSWINKGKDLGLLTPLDMSKITNEMIHGCGGM